MGIVVDEKLDMTQQRALTAQKFNRILGCIKRSVTGRSREVILPLCSGETPPGVLYPALEPPSTGQTWNCFWSRGGPQKDESVEHLCYEGRLRELGLWRREGSRETL